jgi:hypothetical protein
MRGSRSFAVVGSRRTAHRSMRRSARRCGRRHGRYSTHSRQDEVADDTSTSMSARRTAPGFPIRADGLSPRVALLSVVSVPDGSPVSCSASRSNARERTTSNWKRIRRGSHAASGWSAYFGADWERVARRVVASSDGLNPRCLMLRTRCQASVGTGSCRHPGLARCSGPCGHRSRCPGRCRWPARAPHRMGLSSSSVNSTAEPTVAPRTAQLIRRTLVIAWSSPRRRFL